MDMNKPIFPAPPGYIVDVDNPQRTGEAANFWIGTLGMIIAAIFMAIRVYTKTRLAKNFTPDDSKLFSSGRDRQRPKSVRLVSNSNYSSAAHSLGALHRSLKKMACSTNRANNRTYSAFPSQYKSPSSVRLPRPVSTIADLTTQQSNTAAAHSASTSGS